MFHLPPHLPLESSDDPVAINNTTSIISKPELLRGSYLCYSRIFSGQQADIAEYYNKKLIIYYRFRV
jgi:hypothetical protein